jgi:hypothetical protein
MRFPSHLSSIVCLCVLSAIFAFPADAPAADDWQPINPADLALKDNPASPGADAMILYHEQHTDVALSFTDQYYRVKIFTEAGKSHGDIEIPFLTTFGAQEIENIRARTIHPDGTIVPFTGQVFEKEIIKAGGIKVLEKTFSMPDVQPGCILDYKYRIQQNTDYYWNFAWDVQQDLFTRDAVFSIRPSSGPPSASSGKAWFGTPAMYSRTFRFAQPINPEKQKNGDFVSTLHNIPPLTNEDYMLPEGMLRGRVEFFFKSPEDTGLQTTEQFWKNQDKRLNQAVESFVNKKSSMEQLVAQTTVASDSPEVKLRKLYARAQLIRNLSYEDLTSQELKRMKIQAANDPGPGNNRSVEDVVKHGYGYNREINELFVALARAAGFEANEVYVAPRSQHLFMPDLQDAAELDSDVVLVKVAGQDLYLDPAARFYPFGILPWDQTGITGFLINNDGGAFVKIPAASSADAVVERHANMKLNDDGSLSGTLEVDFTGVRASVTRQEERTDDETGRRKHLTDEIKTWLPGGAKFEITKISGWDDNSAPLVVSGALTIPGYVSSLGSRILVPVTPFVAPEPRAFQTATRVNDIYFYFPYQRRDDIVFTLPAGYHVESLPKQPANAPTGAIQYTLAFSQLGNVLQVKRTLTIDGIYYSHDQYPTIRQAFSTVKTGDDEQAVLQTVASANKN